jgi:putative membrane protein
VFHWEVPYYLLILCLLTSAALLQQYRHHAAHAPMPWGFFLSLLGLCVLVSSPLHAIGREALFLGRMLETLIIVYVLPPLALRSLPNALFSYYWKSIHFRKYSFPIRDLVWSSVVFNGLFFLWHLPWIYNLSLVHGFFDESQMFGFWVLGLLMWLPLNIRFAPMRLNTPRRMFYLVTLILGQVPLFAFLTFTREVLYTGYGSAARVIPVSALAEQQMAGWLLKLATSLIFASAFIVVFLDWSSLQRQQDKDDNALAVENFDLVQRALKKEVNRKG